MKERLFIFAADHRGSLKSNVLGIKKEPNKKQLEMLHDFKAMILEALKLAIEKGIKKEDAALLMDEDYGMKQLKEAKKLGIRIIVPVEKSGQRIFYFNYGKNFKLHVEKFKPDYVKVLLHFNPVNKQDNDESLKNLRIFNNYIKTTNYKFLLELLIDPTEEQIKKFGRNGFDVKVRPELTEAAINQLKQAGINPDIWKLEGDEVKKDIDLISSLVENAKIVMLGRSESMSKVLKWIKIAAKNNKVIGFAVGRTIFMQSLQNYYHNKWSREKAIKTMASKYKKIADFYLRNSN